MWLLIIYVLFVIIGGMVSLAVGYYVEINFSSAMSLIVFLSLFFANFAISWFLTIAIVDRIAPEG